MQLDGGAAEVCGERKEVVRLMRAPRSEHTVVGCRLDRLAWSTRDLLNVLDRLGKSGVGFKSLRETAVDTPRRLAW